MTRVGVLVVVAGCSFTGPMSVPGDGAKPVDTTAPDAPIQPLPASRIVAAVTSGGATHLVSRKFDGTALSAGCVDQAVSQPIAALAVNATHPYAYGVQAALDGVPLNCTTTVYATPVGAPSPLQQIVFADALGIGFFTAQGAGAVGVYRFAANTDGRPNLLESDDVPAGAGPLLFAQDAHELVVAGANMVFSYALFGAGFTLPHAHVAAAGCAAPRALLESGGSALLFCEDSPTVRRYTLSPFAAAGDAGQLGDVEQVVAIEGQRAVASSIAPLALAVVTLGDTTSWKVGPSLEARPAALAVSEDGSTVAVAIPLGSQTKLAVYGIHEQDLQLVTSELIDGTIGALAFSAPETP